MTSPKPRNCCRVTVPVLEPPITLTYPPDSYHIDRTLIIWIVKGIRNHMFQTDQYNGRNILVIGGLGFIGSNLAARLVDLGAHVMLVDSLIPEYGGNLFNIDPIKDRVTVNIADVRDEHSMQYLVQNHDFVFNLAGQTSHLDSMCDPDTDLDINCRAQLKFLEACRSNNSTCRIVFASTRQVYGKPEYLPVDELHPLSPVDVNGINKLAGEWYHLLYTNVYGIRSTVLRLTNTIGPRMRVKDALREMELRIHRRAQPHRRSSGHVSTTLLQTHLFFFYL